MTIPITTTGPAPVITFYSYKGGVGRSMAVLNTGVLIASRGFRVLIIDFDLEAPGLSHLYEKKASEPDLFPLAGVVELLHDADRREAEADLFTLSPGELAASYTFAYKLPRSLGKSNESSLSIMPAGRFGNGYPALLEELDLKGLYKDFGEPKGSRSRGQNLILAFKFVLTRSGEYDYILVDSRTGHSEEAGICTRDLADHRMVLSGLNTQNVTGTAEFLTNLRSTFEQAGISLPTPDIILSPIPSSEEDLISRRLNTAANEFKVALGKKPLLNLFIPYHPRLALTEQAYVPPLPTSPLRQAYLAIETRLFKSIGHTDEIFQPQFTELIEKGKGSEALGFLQRWVKLQGLPGDPESRKFPNSYFLLFPGREQIYSKLFLLPESLEILTFIAERSRHGNGLFEIAQRFHKADEKKAGMFDKVLLKLTFISGEDFGNHAIFLHNAGRYPDTTEAFYKRALDADPKDANYLGAYANFLADIRGDHDAAEAFYKRALDVDSKCATNLGNYANLLTDIRKNDDAAEVFYKRALEVDPKHANNLGNYANFLSNISDDHDTAEAFYKRALDADPNDANTLGNYGQFLTGRGRLEEGLRYLRFAWGNRHESRAGNNAEYAYSLWLGTCLYGSEEPAWEGVLKHFIAGGFLRPVWNFDAILAKASLNLNKPTFKYAKALAEAFLDESKVPALEKFARWKKLEPLDPVLVNPDGSISKQT